jgi:hypothetical protein
LRRRTGGTRTGTGEINTDLSRPGPGPTAGLRSVYTAVLYLMPGVLLVSVLLDPALYDRLAPLAPPGYRVVVVGMMRFDQLVTLSVALLSLVAAVQRTRGGRHALRWTAVASYAFLAVPSLVALIPFAYWFLGVRKHERTGWGRAARGAERRPLGPGREGTHR